MSEEDDRMRMSPVSATIMYNEMVKEDFKCPLCGEPMIRVKCSIDSGVTLDGRQILVEAYVRRIDEFSVWMCNMNCDNEMIYRKHVASLGPTEAGKKIIPTKESAQ